MSHDIGRIGGRGGGSGCEERMKPRTRGGEPTTKEKREGEVCIVALNTM